MRSSGGAPERVTQNGGYHPLESPDGRYIYFNKSEHDVWRVPSGGGKEEKVIDGLSVGMNYAVVADGIYFIPHRGLVGGRPEIRFRRSATGKQETVATLGQMAMWGFSVSPDRKAIFYTQGEPPKADLMLVENFR
jgi:hypothetical protein